MSSTSRYQSTESKRSSLTGQNLYQILNLDESATSDDIEKAYQSLSIKYESHRYPNTPENALKLKEINKAHTILSNKRKRRIYDTYGQRGLQAANRVGEDNVAKIIENPCFKYIFIGCFFLTCGCFCCGGFCCCCCFCCGRGLKKDEEAGSPEANSEAPVIIDQPISDEGSALRCPSNDEEGTPSETLPLKGIVDT